MSDYGSLADSKWDCKYHIFLSRNIEESSYLILNKNRIADAIKKMHEIEKKFVGEKSSEKLDGSWIEMKICGLKIGEILGSLTY